MFCTNCGTKAEALHRFCASCGCGLDNRDAGIRAKACSETELLRSDNGRSTERGVAGSRCGLTPSASRLSLWNPNAAANWSVIFTPIFGASLLTMNSRAAGDRGRFNWHLGWLMACCVAYCVAMGLSVQAAVEERESMVPFAVYFGSLLVWYFAACRPEAMRVSGLYRDGSTRRSWLAPVSVGVIGRVILWLLEIGVLAIAIDRY